MIIPLRGRPLQGTQHACLLPSYVIPAGVKIFDVVKSKKAEFVQSCHLLLNRLVGEVSILKLKEKRKLYMGGQLLMTHVRAIYHILLTNSSSCKL
jgi:hypothetical protein